MVAVRSMLARVRQLEIEKANPMLARLDGEAGWASLQADVQNGLADNRYDRRDMTDVMDCVRRWLMLPV